MRRLLTPLRHRLRRDQDLLDGSLEALGRTCDDCRALPFEPCSWSCSSRWS